MLCSMIFYDTSRLARGILCDGKNSSTLCIIRLKFIFLRNWKLLKVFFMHTLQFRLYLFQSSNTLHGDIITRMWKSPLDFYFIYTITIVAVDLHLTQLGYLHAEKLFAI